jgi:hypothetical protein
VLLLLPGPRVQAAAPSPEISADEWAAINNDFAKELESLPKPTDPRDQELQNEMKKLAELLKQNPEKKDALKELARLSDRIEKQRQALGTRQTSMKAAAKALASSKALKQFASKLKDGAYKEAADELKKVSKELKSGKLSPDASEFESMAADMQRMAQELAQDQELEQACQDCSGAANSMNRESLAEALKRLAEQMDKKCDSMCEGDKLSRARSMLDELKRRMNQCQGECDKEGQCEGDKQGNGKGNRKGGLKAGWGTMAKWDGGSMTKADQKTSPEMVNPQERAGASTSFTIVSPDEKAQSALKYQELYAEFVQKSEADLDLDSVPVAYRDYLRRYFNSIRPEEAAPADPAAPAPPATEAPKP